MGYNPAKVNEFKSLLKNVLYTQKFNAFSVWNMDESGVTTVQKPIKIVSMKGKKQVSRVTSAEKGLTVTLLCCMSAAGQFVPPMFIFPRKRMAPGLMNGAPPGSVAAVSDSGWTDQNRFVDWLGHFIDFTKASKDNPQLIILDGHNSHKTLAAVDKARDCGITIITLPPHTTHKLQPLDRTYFKPFKSYYNRAADNWICLLYTSPSPRDS